MSTSASDITVTDEGTLVLMRPTSDGGWSWIHENIDPAATWFREESSC